jgi:hypothetical protein
LMSYLIDHKSNKTPDDWNIRPTQVAGTWLSPQGNRSN